MVSRTSLVPPAIGGILDWNIPPPRSKGDIRCDLEVVVSASISAKTFGGHNTSRLNNSSTFFSTVHKKKILQLKKLFAL